jgi:putative membrane protein
MIVVLAQMMDRDDVGTGAHWWMWATGLLVAVVLVGLVVWAVVRVTTQGARAGGGTSGGTGGGNRSADEILAERFARGEIDAEEYRQRRSALRG